MTTLDQNPAVALYRSPARPGSLAAALQAPLLTFPGLDVRWPSRLRTLCSGRPWLSAWVDEVTGAVADWATDARLWSTGWNIADTLHADCDDASARQAPYALAGTVLLDLASLTALESDGLADVVSNPATIVTGHSAGLIAAAAAGGGVPGAVAAVELALAMGICATQAARTAGMLGSPDQEVMAAVIGPQTDRLVELLSDGVELAMINAPGRHVVSGSPQALQAFEALLTAQATAEAAAHKRGHHPGAPLRFTWEPLPGTVPFHHSALTQAAHEVAQWGIELRPTLTTLDPATGLPLPVTNTAAAIAASVLSLRQDWAATLAAATPTTIIAVADSPGVHTLTDAAVEGTGSLVLHTETTQGRRALFVPGAELPHVADYRDFAPQQIDGRLVTKHTRLTGNSPYILAGMTPTTVDAGIVAAAANAGHVAELAGGGQVTEDIFTERMVELTELLTPGTEITFNALHLDPYLWDLHLGTTRLVQKARAAGAPICGVTISAGMPATEEAVEILDELNDLGIWLNAVKPGDVKGVKAALAIAEETDHLLWVHLEGGQAGGHHSWDDLEELLLETYPLIRRHDNVVLAVGGGVGTPERATELLTGTWSLKHGAPVMPVDAILLGTATMACAESTASTSVKRALAAATGPVEGWVRRAEFEAGMTSGLSGLNADIHFLDNSASRTAALLDEVAGDAESVDARREEIVAALATTAKPYFGDVATFSYRQLLSRFIELAAIGSDGRYEDGVWLDRSHRSRFLDLVHRTEARLHSQDEGAFAPVVIDVDDPQQVLAALEVYPLDTRLHPADVDYFLTGCRRAGKPVPFVPVIDADVRKWFQSDALWQSHHERYDADQVLVIPGPAAVGGIAHPDEPVASLMTRFEADCLPQATPAYPATALKQVLQAPVVQWAGRSRPNPLRRIGAWEITADGAMAVWTAGEEYARLTQVGDARVELEIGWQPLTDDDGTMDLAFDVEGATVTVSGLAQPLAAEAPALVGADQSHATLIGASSLLPDATMRGLWPRIFAAIADTAPEGMLDLVHARHHIARSALAIEAAVVTAEEQPGGFTLTTTAGDGTWTSTDTFFVRQPGRLPEVDASTAATTEWVDTPHLLLGTTTVTAPESLEAFAVITGDLNPIHRSDALARFVGLPGRIVHGMWTSAFGQRAALEIACAGDPTRLIAWDIAFTAPLLPGAELAVTVTRTGVAGGNSRIEVLLEADSEVIAIGTATVAPVSTAYVFPGQGIQHVGMGMDGYDRSEAAREVWDRADAHTLDALGFSILEVVRDNPTSLVAGMPGDPDAGVTYRHPAGVLFLTQFTQVAMATLATAQVAEMRERGVFDERAITAGHSVGEYNALAAVTGTLALEDLLELVFARGTAMHHLVPRDEKGASDFRLAVVRPHLAGLDHAQTDALVERVAADTGQLCQIVNHNLKGKQYAVAGTVAALEELQSRLGAGRNGKAPFLLVPGIDVPFHSAALLDGVPEFRRHLEQRLPDSIEPSALVGRYVPNLYPVPFAVTPEYTQGIQEVCGSQILADLLNTWDEHTEGEITRTLLVELLAWQFAMPVRWIETTDVLCRELGVERIIEVGVGAQPTLTNLTKGALALDSHRGSRPAVMNVETDEDEVFAQTATPAPVVEEEEPQAQDATAAAAPAPSAPAVAAAAVEDRPVTHADAVRALIAIRVGIRPEQVEGTIEDLVDGASSRRNQLLMDLGKEFGVSGMDGAHEAPLSDVAAVLSTKAAGYRFPGPVLSAWLDADAAAVMGRAGVNRGALASRLRDHWGLGDGWVDQTLLTIGLGGREGTSKRGGDLQTLTTSGTALVDDAVQLLAAALGITVSPVAATGGGVAVDAGAVTELEERFEDLLADAALSILTGLGKVQEPQTADTDPASDRLRVLDAEHGAGRAQDVAGTFDVRRHVHLESSTQWARAEVDHLVQGAAAGAADLSLIEQIAVHREADPRIEATLRWYLQRTDVFGDAAAEVRTVVEQALAAIPSGIAVDLDGLRTVVPAEVLAATDDLTSTPGAFSGEVALVTGASPNSIALSSVAHLLRGAATVVLVTSSDTPERIASYRELERRYAAPGAALHIVRANLASFSDIEDVVEWLTTPTVRSMGPVTKEVKPALWPTILLPFAAGRSTGSLADTGPDNEVTLRLQTLGVQRLVGSLGERIARAGQQPVRVVLPLSPNHGTFGGDGSYGDSKAALETILNRWHAEQKAWASGTRLIGAEIGWVRGTGLMAANDAVADHIEDVLGVRTFTSAQMGALIAGLCRLDVDTPQRLDLTGGLSQAGSVAEALKDLPTGSTVEAEPQDLLEALPTPAWPTPTQTFDVTPTIDLDDMVVIAGISEIGPWGGSATRWQAELGELTADAVTELAWRMGLITWDREAAAWTDADGTSIDEAGIAEAFRDVVQDRVGLREFEVTPGVAADGTLQLQEIYLDKPLTVGETTYPAGTAIRVPVTRPLQRQVGGQFPQGADPTRHGLEQGLAQSMDPLAAWNLVVTAEALVAAGVSAQDLAEAVHPSLIGNVQGTGMGGMDSLHALYVDPLLGTSHANDLLQEALGNVVSAHVNQSLLGGYGPMVHPVAACATAAVSLEEAVDKIRLGKADILMAGGYDDLSSEGINGFADMAATADNQELIAAGIPPRGHSRPGDRRRAGFVESQGGGSFLVVRGSVALRLGLPVRAVVAYAASFGDGVQTSIPAPGLGALGAARGGAQSPLATALAAHGLQADDIAVVSKHDTSTNANDPNEAFIHATISEQLGRSEGAPLRVISQKSVTGHAKGGAAAWQMAGLCDVFATSTLPGNRNLVSVDPEVAVGPLVVDYEPLHRAEPVRAAVLTSLGFGHVSALVALAHPHVFVAAIPQAEREEYLQRSGERRLDGAWQLLAARYGGTPAFARRTERPAKADEVDLLIGANR